MRYVRLPIAKCGLLSSAREALPIVVRRSSRIFPLRQYGSKRLQTLQRVWVISARLWRLTREPLIEMSRYVRY